MTLMHPSLPTCSISTSATGGVRDIFHASFPASLHHCCLSGTQREEHNYLSNRDSWGVLHIFPLWRKWGTSDPPLPFCLSPVWGLLLLRKHCHLSSDVSFTIHIQFCNISSSQGQTPEAVLLLLFYLAPPHLPLTLNSYVHQHRKLFSLSIFFIPLP